MTFRSNIQYRLIAWLTACAMLLGLSACGGGSGTSGDAANAAGPGRVAVLFTDGPTSDFQHINVTVTGVQLLSATGAQTLYSGTKTFDLLGLSSHAEMFSLADAPSGDYDKIRLTVTNVELVRQDTSGAVIATIHPKLPGNGKLDLVPRAPIVVAADHTLYLQLDIDAAKSIHIVKTGNGKYIFRPVVFVDVLSAATPGKVVRVHGHIQTIDLDAQTLSVCNSTLAWRTLTGSHDTSPPTPACMTVQVDQNTSLFDAAGDPALLSDLQVDDEVTVLGRFVPSTDTSQSLEFHAAVIEVGPAGTYTQIQGDVQSVATDQTGFALNVAAGQGYAAGTVLQVMLQDGTKIFSRDGTLLTPAAMAVGDAVKVEGVVVLSNTDPDGIKAAAVFVDKAALDGPITGTLGPIDVANNAFTLITTGGDRCVTLDTGAHIFQITTTSAGFTSEAISLSDLVSGQQVDVYGPLQLNGCYLAHDVLAAAP
ncbi:MAG: DUF4382 domain-containing protein [Gammaproteobacteria bacterium]|jgi:hypothetical protein